MCNMLARYAYVSVCVSVFVLKKKNPRIYKRLKEKNGRIWRKESVRKYDIIKL